MSLDVYLYDERDVDERCHCGHGHRCKETSCVFSYNITHNLNSMADAAGTYKAMWRPEEIGAKRAGDLICHLRDGLAMLKRNPEAYRVHNPSNGWGSYEGLVEFAEKYLAACEEYPNARIEVSR